MSLKRFLSFALVMLLILEAFPVVGLALERKDGAAAEGSAEVRVEKPSAKPDPEPPAMEPEEQEYGLGGEPGEKPFNTWVSDAAELEPPKRSLPARYNAADLGLVTPVKSQGQYGTCWAHAALSCIETYMIKYGVVNAETNLPADRSIDLSEYHLAWFTYTDAYDRLGMLAGDRTVPILTEESPSFLDIGGTSKKAAMTLMRGEGPASEAVVGLAYADADPAGLDPTHAFVHNAAQFTDWDCIPFSNRNTIKQKIVEHGSGAVSMHYDKAYLNARTGGYCLIQTVSQSSSLYKNANHDVTVVGWDDNYSKDNFPEGNRPQQDGAWIIKNSHGTKNGLNGYFYLSYEDTESLASTCSFFRAAAANTYSRIYQYDGTLSGRYQYSDASDFWVLNYFDIDTNVELSAAAIHTLGEGVSYTMSICLDPGNDNDPYSGTVLRTVSGTFTYEGYHTVPFEPVLAGQGHRVAVAFHLNCPTEENGQYVRVGVDADSSLNNCSNYHAVREGVSWYRKNATSAWTKKTNGNYRIKLFANETDVLYREGTWHLLENKVEDFTLDELYADGRKVVKIDTLGGSLPAGMRLLWEENAVRFKGIPTGIGSYTIRYCFTLSDQTVVDYTVNTIVCENDPTISTELLLLPYLQETKHRLHADWGTGGVTACGQISGSTPAGTEIVIEGLTVPELQGTPFKKGDYTKVMHFLCKDGTNINHMLKAKVFDASKPIEEITFDLSHGPFWIGLSEYTNYVRPTLTLLKQDGRLGFAEGAANDFMVDVDNDGTYDMFGLFKNSGYYIKLYARRTIQRDYTVKLSDSMLSSLGSRTDYAKQFTVHIEPRLIPSFFFDLGDGLAHRILLDDYTSYVLFPLYVLNRDGMIGASSEGDYTYLDLDMDGTNDLYAWTDSDYIYFRATDEPSLQYTEKTLTASQQQELSGTNSAIKLRFSLPQPVKKYKLWVDGVQVTEKNQNDILGNGVFDYNGLTLNIHGNYNHKNKLVVSEIPGLLIFTSEDSNMYSINGEMGLDLKADATIWGPGKLTLDNCRVGVYLSTGSVSVRVHYTEIEASGTWGVAGENAGEHLYVDDASITAWGSSGAICDITYIVLNKARVVEPKGGYILNDDVVDKNGNVADYAAIYSDRKYNPFVDVKEGSFYYDAVLWAANRIPQVAKGTDETHFSPGKNCTRGQVVTFLWRANDMPTPGITTCSFVDVKPGAYYYDAMLWAVGEGITSGKDATHFRPAMDCSRGEVVTFLWRAAGSPEPMSATCPFTDVKPTAYYYKAMLWALENHITTGATATTFAPGKICTRAQVVTFLYRTYGPKG